MKQSDRFSHDFTNVCIIHESEINFLAKGVRYGKWYVIKGLNPEFRNNEACIAMLQKEFELLIGLKHPNIRSAVSFEEHDEFGPAMVMEYTDGTTLSEWLQTSPPFSERFRVARQILDAVGYVHEKSIIHRDIKPDNILITRIGKNVQLIDFGLSDSDTFAILKHPAGTPSYISPEQATSSVPDPRNDIYSCGKVLQLLLPERRFKTIINDCLREASQRPENTGVVISRLDRARKRNLLYPLIIATAVVAAVIVFMALRPTSQTQQPDVDPPEEKAAAATDMADSIASAPATEAEPIENTPEIEEEALQTVVNQATGDTRNAEPEKTVALPPPVTNPSSESGSKTMSGTEAVKYMTEGGRNTLNMIWKKTALQFLDTVSDPRLIPGAWNLSTLRNAKSNYMETLEYDLTSPDFRKKYPLKKEDLTEISKNLDLHIEQLNKEWIKKSNSKK